MCMGEHDGERATRYAAAASAMRYAVAGRAGGTRSTKLKEDMTL